MSQLPDFGSFAFPLARIGGGGWCTRVVALPGGRLLTRTDTHNGYVRSPGGEWRPMIRAGDNIAAGLLDLAYLDPSPWGATGVYEIDGCDADPNTAYVVCMGYVYKTSDGFATLTRTALAQQPNLNPNEGSRMNGPCAAVDPANPNVFWLCTPAGVRFTQNGGATWTSVATSTLPAPSGGRAFVAFDRASAVTGGRTQTLYVFVNGSGLYRSTNAGASWAAAAGAPTTAGHLAVNPHNGDVALVGMPGNESNGQYRRLSGGAWSTPAGFAGHGIAFSPLNPNLAVLYTENGQLRVSSDSGVSFGALLPQSRTAATIPWHAATNEAYMSSGGCAFDHVVPNRLHFAEGIGLWFADFDPASATSILWQENSAGIEQLVTTHLAVTPNGRLLGSFHDRAFFSIGRAQTAYPAGHGLSYVLPIDHGQMADWAPEDPEFFVAVNFRADVQTGGFSEDGGRTWQPFPVSLGTYQGKGGGNIVACSKTNFIWLPTNQGYPMFSKDGGASWTACDINGQRNFGWHNSYTLNRQVLAADKMNPGRAVIYNVGSDTDPNGAVSLATRGIWRTNDGGASWTRIRSTHIESLGADFWNAKLKFVPGVDNHLFFCGGDNSGALYRSTDGGVNWSAVPGSGETFCFGFGKPARGGMYPAILAVGYRSGEFGLWLSLDGAASWTKAAEYPAGRFDYPVDLAGDIGRFGRFYIGYGGSGVLRSDFTATLTAM